MVNSANHGVLIFVCTGLVLHALALLAGCALVIWAGDASLLDAEMKAIEIIAPLLAVALGLLKLIGPGKGRNSTTATSV